MSPSTRGRPVEVILFYALLIGGIGVAATAYLYLIVTPVGLIAHRLGIAASVAYAGLLGATLYAFYESPYGGLSPGFAPAGMRANLFIVGLFQDPPVAMLVGVWTAGPQRGRAIVAALYFLPLLMSAAAIAVLFSALIDPNFGLPSALPWLFGDGNLLGTSPSAMAVVAFVLAWQYVPFHSLIYQAAARAVPFPRSKTI